MKFNSNSFFDGIELAYAYETPYGVSLFCYKKNGVLISEINDMGGVKYAYFADPDGNSWALQQILKTTKAQIMHTTKYRLESLL